MNLTSLPLTCLPPHPPPHSQQQFNTFSGKIFSDVRSIWPNHLSALYSTFLTPGDEISICSPPVFHSSLNFSCSSYIPKNNRIRHLNFNRLFSQWPHFASTQNGTVRHVVKFVFLDNIRQNQKSNL